MADSHLLVARSRSGISHFLINLCMLFYVPLHIRVGVNIRRKNVLIIYTLQNVQQFGLGARRPS